jgi:DNA-binding response OmpR family regulator
MIVEDEALTGLVLAEALKDEGHRIIGPFASQHEALDTLDHSRPDVAILDLALQDGLCSGLAGELRRRNLPFVVLSGHRRERITSDVLRDVPWIEKPGRLVEITAALERLAQAGTSRGQGEGRWE